VSHWIGQYSLTTSPAQEHAVCVVLLFVLFLFS